MKNVRFATFAIFVICSFDICQDSHILRTFAEFQIHFRKSQQYFLQNVDAITLQCCQILPSVIL